MPTITLRRIAEPPQDTRKVVRGGNDVIGLEESRGGDTTYLCGGCGATLAADVSPGRTADLVFECPDCGAFNETPAPIEAFE
jgi:hypothetical protein